ncbi:MAG: MotA/TolQ/ExbB proton channel family protein, partial [Burkholderiaceae bacterium]
MEGQALGLAHFWNQADGVIRFTAWLLLAMSVTSWFLIFWKSWQWLRVRATAEPIARFWSAPGIDAGLALLRPADRETLFLPLAQTAAQRAATLPATGTLAAQLGRNEAHLAALRDALNASLRRIDSGLSWLASIGATAPFIGLFGTVWGIYHALIEIAVSGQMSIAKIAGPVGEALVMTAAGLAVAIPAVLAYNAFVRGNRTIA